jgi:host factor-I protein
MRTESKIETVFLASLMHRQTKVMMYLINGIKLDGVIVDYDKNCLVLERFDQSQLIFLHAIATICPVR